MGITSRNLNGNQGTFDRDLGKIFVFDNDYIEGTFLNNTGADLDLVGGELIGRIPGTEQLVILSSAAVDGSEIPVGINASCVSVLDTATANISICISGDVVESKVILDGADTLATVIASRTIRDRIAADTKGIRLVPSSELTNFDN